MVFGYIRVKMIENLRSDQEKGEPDKWKKKYLSSGYGGQKTVLCCQKLLWWRETCEKADLRTGKELWERRKLDLGSDSWKGRFK